jgi:hypothetical protein
MSVSLPIAERRHVEQPPATVLTPPVGAPLTFDTVPLDQSRWDAWVTKGRIADAAFAEKARTLSLVGLVFAVAAGAVWSIFG